MEARTLILYPVGHTDLRPQPVDGSLDEGYRRRVPGDFRPLPSQRLQLSARPLGEYVSDHTDDELASMLVSAAAPDDIVFESPRLTALAAWIREQRLPGGIELLFIGTDQGGTSGARFKHTDTCHFADVLARLVNAGVISVPRNVRARAANLVADAGRLDKILPVLTAELRPIELQRIARVILVSGTGVPTVSLALHMIAVAAVGSLSTRLQAVRIPEPQRVEAPVARDITDDSVIPRLRQAMIAPQLRGLAAFLIRERDFELLAEVLAVSGLEPGHPAREAADRAAREEGPDVARAIGLRETSTENRWEALQIFCERIAKHLPEADALRGLRNDVAHWDAVGDPLTLGRLETAEAEVAEAAGIDQHGAALWRKLAERAGLDVGDRPGAAADEVARLLQPRDAIQTRPDRTFGVMAPGEALARWRDSGKRKEDGTRYMVDEIAEEIEAAKLTQTTSTFVEHVELPAIESAFRALGAHRGELTGGRELTRLYIAGLRSSPTPTRRDTARMAGLAAAVLERCRVAPAAVRYGWWFSAVKEGGIAAPSVELDIGDSGSVTRACGAAVDAALEPMTAQPGRGDTVVVIDAGGAGPVRAGLAIAAIGAAEAHPTLNVQFLQAPPDGEPEPVDLLAEIRRVGETFRVQALGGWLIERRRFDLLRYVVSDPADRALVDAAAALTQGQPTGLDGLRSDHRAHGPLDKLTAMAGDGEIGPTGAAIIALLKHVAICLDPDGDSRLDRDRRRRGFEALRYALEAATLLGTVLQVGHVKAAGAFAAVFPGMPGHDEVERWLRAPLADSKRCQGPAVVPGGIDGDLDVHFARQLLTCVHKGCDVCPLGGPEAPTGLASIAYAHERLRTKPTKARSLVGPANASVHRGDAFDFAPEAMIGWIERVHRQFGVISDSDVFDPGLAAALAEIRTPGVEGVLRRMWTALTGLPAPKLDTRTDIAGRLADAALRTAGSGPGDRGERSRDSI